MKPWSHDASDLNPKEVTEAYIYKNEVIDEYLSASSHEKRMFLIGSKGTGKTLLLRYKAFKYWSKQQTEQNLAYQASQSQELVESLSFNIATLSRKELEHLSDYNTWVRIWDFAITLTILRRSRISIPPGYEEIDDLFPPHYTLNATVSKILNNSSKFIFSRFFKCNNELQAQLSLIRNLFVLFIDRLDQALDSILNNEEYKYQENGTGENIAFKVWRSAQFGLLVTCYNLTTAINAHIKVFATARLEAMSTNSQLRQNINNYCTYLFYSKSELREIFLNNIRLIPQNRYALPTGEDLIHRYFGFTNMNHPRAIGPGGAPIQEKVFDFLCRHTFERPREIVLLGSVLYDKLISKPDYPSKKELDKIEEVRRITNETSHNTIFRDYLTEIVPSFKMEYLEKCSTIFHQNLISRIELRQVDREIINYLYRIGLIGYNHNGYQVFLPASKHINDHFQKIHNADYYFLHPSLDSKLQEIKPFIEYYNRYNIIGNNYPFYLPPPFTENSFTGRTIDFYIPLGIPGKNLDEENWRQLGILVEPQKLYRMFFIELDDQNLLEKRNEKFDAAFKMLSVVAFLCLINEVEKKYNTTFETWRSKLADQLEALKGENDYAVQISDYTPESLMKFGNKLFGRLVTTGLLCFLRLDYPVIHSLVNLFQYHPAPKTVTEDSALRYLRKAFFIKGMRSAPPREREEAHTLLNWLSPFEKEHLMNWWVYFKNHELLASSRFNEEQKTFLEKTLSDLEK